MQNGLKDALNAVDVVESVASVVEAGVEGGRMSWGKTKGAELGQRPLLRAPQICRDQGVTGQTTRNMVANPVSVCPVWTLATSGLNMVTPRPALRQSLCA